MISAGIYNNYTYNVERRSKGYRFGLPEYSKGVDSEMEVTEYDEDEWRDHIGYDSEPDEIFGGTEYDADIEGAKSKSEILDWERKKDNLPFFADSVLETRIEVEDIPTAENLYDVCDYITTSINNLSDPNSTTPIITGLKEAFDMIDSLLFIFSGKHIEPYTPWWWAWQNATYANSSVAAYIFDANYVKSAYNKYIDGYLLHRGYWYWTSKDFKKSPDIPRFDVPFIIDPEDWYKTYEILASFKTDFLGSTLDLIDILFELNSSINRVRDLTPSNYTAIQNILLAGLTAAPPNGLGLPDPPDEWKNQLHWLLIDAALNPTGENWLQQQSGGAKGLYAVTEGLANQIPGKFGFLWQLLIEGLPVLTPVDKYLTDVVEAFDIDGLAVETGIKGLDPATQIIGDVWVDGNTIILEFEYADSNEKRDGWKVEFIYSEHGTQESVVFSGSEIFYEQESLPSSLEQRILPVIFGLIIIISFSAIAIISVYIRHNLRLRKAKKIRKKYIENKIVK
ncbi:MAG: hypothetical protein ACFFAS_20825 [Promethearchaeota archaeon]